METCCSTLACVSSSEECLLKKYLLSNCVLIFPILCGTVHILFPYILSGILSAIWLANLILAFVYFDVLSGILCRFYCL